MESAAQRFVRVLSALEDLAAQESAALRLQDFARLADLQERAAPLVEFLVSQPDDLALDASVRSRLAELHAARQLTSESLAQEIARTREALGQAAVVQRRVAQVAPAYRAPTSREPAQLRAVG